MNTSKLGAPAPTPSTLNLVKSRKAKGVTLEEIAERTKISLRFLRAIEAEEFEKLPGGIFATSYLRQYAAAIGLAELELLARYNSAMDGSRSASTLGAGSRQGTRSLFDRWLRLSTSA